MFLTIFVRISFCERVGSLTLLLHASNRVSSSNRPGRRWNFVSDDAKNLIRGLMKFEASARATATWSSNIYIYIIYIWDMPNLPQFTSRNVEMGIHYNFAREICLHSKRIFDARRLDKDLTGTGQRIIEWSHGEQGEWDIIQWLETVVHFFPRLKMGSLGISAK